MPTWHKRIPAESHRQPLRPIVPPPPHIEFPHFSQSGFGLALVIEEKTVSDALPTSVLDTPALSRCPIGGKRRSLERSRSPLLCSSACAKLLYKSAVDATMSRYEPFGNERAVHNDFAAASRHRLDLFDTQLLHSSNSRIPRTLHLVRRLPAIEIECYQP
jgi:hypothetical protein